MKGKTMKKVSKLVKKEKQNRQQHLLEFILTADELKEMATHLYGYELTNEEMDECSQVVAQYEANYSEITNAIKEALEIALPVVVDPAGCNWQKACPKHKAKLKKALTETKAFFGGDRSLRGHLKANS